LRAKKGQFATCKRPTFKFCSKDNAGKLYFDIVEGFCYCGGVFQNAGTFFAPPVDVSRGFRATCRQNFILQCLRVVVKAGVFKTIVSTAEQSAFLFSRWS